MFGGKKVCIPLKQEHRMIGLCEKGRVFLPEEIVESPSLEKPKK